MTVELSRSRPNVIRIEPRALRFPADRRFIDKITGLASDNAWRKVKLDLRKVDCITADALGKIVTLHLKLRAKEVRLVVQNVNPHVYETFVVTGLTSILDVRPA